MPRRGYSHCPSVSGRPGPPYSSRSASRLLLSSASVRKTPGTVKRLLVASSLHRAEKHRASIDGQVLMLLKRHSLDRFHRTSRRYGSDSPPSADLYFSW